MEDKDKITAEEILKISKEKIKNLLDDIENTTDKDTKKKLYEDLLELDNVKEEYSFSYLKFLFDEMKEKFEENLKKRHICISDNNLKYFKIYNRKNSKSKIIEFINLIKNSNMASESERKECYFKIYMLIKEENLDFESKKEITWENEELYLYNLYIFLLDAMNKQILYYSKPKHEDENRKVNNEKMENFLKSDFFVVYTNNFINFLKCVDQNFRIRFNNCELKDMNDKSLFEDYITFLGTYDFRTDLDDYINIWKETFVALTQKEKIDFISGVNLFISNKFKNISYNIQLNEIIIKYETNKKTITIKDADKYAFKPFVTALTLNSDDSNIDWYKDKFLKPNIYKNNLLACLKKDIWKELLIKILNSEIYKEIGDKLYKGSQINFFSLTGLISKIIDDIIFISYKTSFYCFTRKNTFKTYEKGLYNKDIHKKSIALLKFYAFNIIINFHQIGGHINVKLQHYYNSKDFQKSPNINNIYY